MKRRHFLIALGAAAAWPLAAGAQPAPMPLIGFVSGRGAGDSVQLVAAFQQGLAETGFVEGKNIAIDFRWADGDYDRLPALTADLVSHKVAVLVGVGGDVSALAAAKATTTIPVVFGMGSDPLKAGIVASFNRPGGNVTGFTLWTSEMESKRLGSLRELVPGVARIGVLINPRFPPAVQEAEELQADAKSVAQQLFVVGANDDAELDAALTTIAQQRVGALLVAAAPFFDTRRDRILAFAAQSRLPAIISSVAGGLISYGPSVGESYKNAGVYVGRILKGEKPGDLPVLQPTKFDFVINLKTAKALGLAVPPTLSAEAGEVIE